VQFSELFSKSFRSLLLMFQVNEANVLFIDSPVGTGYSYVEDDSLYNANVLEMADDLVTLMKTFMDYFPQFRVTSFVLKMPKWNTFL
jgi:Serine carboxypeptidase